MSIFEINFVPARGKGIMMSYTVKAATLIAATAEARRYVNIEAPRYKLHSHREVAA